MKIIKFSGFVVLHAIFIILFTFVFNFFYSVLLSFSILGLSYSLFITNTKLSFVRHFICYLLFMIISLSVLNFFSFYQEQLSHKNFLRTEKWVEEYKTPVSEEVKENILQSFYYIQYLNFKKAEQLVTKLSNSPQIQKYLKRWILNKKKKFQLCIKKLSVFIPEIQSIIPFMTNEQINQFVTISNDFDEVNKTKLKELITSIKIIKKHHDYSQELKKIIMNNLQCFILQYSNDYQFLYNMLYMFPELKREYIDLLGSVQKNSTSFYFFTDNLKVNLDSSNSLYEAHKLKIPLDNNKMMSIALLITNLDFMLGYDVKIVDGKRNIISAPSALILEDGLIIKYPLSSDLKYYKIKNLKKYFKYSLLLRIKPYSFNWITNNYRARYIDFYFHYIFPYHKQFLMFLTSFFILFIISFLTISHFGHRVIYKNKFYKILPLCFVIILSYIYSCLSMKISLIIFNHIFP